MPIPVLATVYLGVVVTLFAYGLYNYGVSQIPANQAAGFINLIPVFSVLLGMLILGETMNFWQWCACGLVFGGVLVSRRLPVDHAGQGQTGFQAQGDGDRRG